MSSVLRERDEPDFPSVWWRHATLFEPGTRIGIGGERRMLLLVRSGWVARGRLLSNGRRQIIDLLLPGDHHVAQVEAASPRDVFTALNACEVARLPYGLVEQALSSLSDLDAKMRDAERRRVARLEERLVSLGQRDGVQRAAHLFCEHIHRVGADATADESEYPLTQADIADLLGLSAVHTNRVLQTLKRLGLASLQRGRLAVHDRPALESVADFSPDYLR